MKKNTKPIIVLSADEVMRRDLLMLKLKMRQHSKTGVRKGVR